VAEHRRLADGGVITAEPESPVETQNGKPERVVSDIKEVRSSDIEPYTGLRYLSKLFRFMAVILVLLLVAEIVTGVYTQGSASIPTLLGEASRLIVLAGVLWGTGDLAHLLIDVGHDVRAARILVARVAHAAKVAPLSAPRSRDQTIADRIPLTKGFGDAVDTGDGSPIP
jgi:hypothetical protein